MSSTSDDRVGYRGLRRGTLPHHRTYGSPYPAVGPSGLTAGREIRRHPESVTLQIAVRQGRVHHRPRRDKPSAATRRYIAQLPLGHAQAPQCAASTPHTVPAQPEALPYVPPNPALQPKDRAPVLGQPVITPPADDIPPPLVASLPARHTAATAPDLSHLLLESLDTLRCRFSLPPAVDAKPQELPFPRPPRPALRLVHLQSQMFLDPVLNPRQHPLRRRLAACINVAVVGVAAGIFSPWRAKWDASWPVVMPSMPAAPWLRFTAASARRRFSWPATCSIRSSCIAFCRESRGSRSGSRRPWLAAAPPLLPPPAPRRVPPAGKDLSARDSGKPLARSASRSSSFAPWSFSPSLQRRYPPSSLLWPLLTSPPLSRRSSPQVRRCFCPFIPPGSTSHVSYGLRASRWPARLPPVGGLSAGSCSCGQRFVSRFLRLGRATCAPRLALCGSLRLAPAVPAGSFHPARISPCWAHWRTAPGGPRRH